MSRLCSALGSRARFVWRLTLTVALIAVVVLALAGVIDPLQSGALTMLPALALLAVMVTRPYLGEHAIARLRARRVRQTGVATLAGASQRPLGHAARGGRLIAVALAGRAPPVVLVGCC